MATAELEAASPRRPAPWVARGWAAVRAEPLLVGLTVLAAVLRFATIDQQSYWFDEAFTVALVGEPFPDMLHRITETEATPPLYYATAWVWTHVFGTGEVGLRSLSAVLGTATVPVLFAAGKAFVSRRAGLVAAALAATSPLLIWYSQEARAHALLLLLGAASLYFFARALDDANRRNLAAWAVVSALGVLTFYLAGLLFAAQAVVLAWEPMRRRAVVWAGAGVAVVVAAIVPYALSQDPGDRTGYQALSLVERAMDVPNEFIFGRASYGRLWFFWPSLLLLAVLAAGLVTVLEGWERRRALLAFGLSLGVLVPTLVLHFLGSSFDYFHYRPGIQAWLPAAIGVGAILGAPRLGRLGVAAVVVACTIGLAAHAAIVLDDSVHRENRRDIMAAVGPRDRDRALLMFPWGPTSGAELYRPTVALPLAGVPVRELVVILQVAHLPDYIDPDTRWFRVPAAFRRVEHRRIQSFVLDRYRAPRPRVVTPGQVVLVRRFLSFARLDQAPAHRRPPTRSP
ncbi:MAG: glycosyltransferase family 39 protein [Gaiellaceae bacterium]